MEHAGDGATDAGVESFHRIGVDRAAHIFAPGMLNHIVRGEALTEGDERAPRVAHQMGCGHVDLCLEDPFGLVYGEIDESRVPRPPPTPGTKLPYDISILPPDLQSYLLNPVLFPRLLQQPAQLVK